MSVSSLPEWKQLLLERKRREEEERERREKEEEEKLASMPAWKRGIIQRRRAKQEVVGDRDREREGFFLAMDGKPPYDGLSDADSSVMVHLGSKPSLSPDPSQWLDDGDTSRPQSQVSIETIVPVHKNPFIRTQSGWRKGREAERAGEVGCQEKGQELETEVGKDKEREKDKPAIRGHDGELGGGRDSQSKMERCRDRSEGRERDRSTGRESIRERERDMKSLKGRKEEEREERDLDYPSPLFPPLVPGLHTIRADNIIIIEQDRQGSDERRGRWRETEREKLEEDHQEKRGVKMDLREILAGGGSVTEIKASEVLIIKPSVGPEDRSGGGGVGGGGGGGGKGSGNEDGEREREVKCTRDGEEDGTGREQRSEPSWLRDKENETFKEKERPWGQAMVIKEDRKDCSDDSVFAERGGRVSQLLSKFGEHPGPPSRSKSTDCFMRPGRDEASGENDDDPSKEGRVDGKNSEFRGVPKRSFSFSDRVVCAKENAMIDEGQHEMKVVERMAPTGEATEGERSEKGSTLHIKQAWNRFSDQNWVGKQRDGLIKTGRQPEDHTEKEHVTESGTRSESEVHASTQHRAEISAVEKVEPVDKRAVEMADDVNGDEGFTVASVKNTEGVSFARRVPIRPDGRVRAVEREKRLREENERALERERGIERGSAGGRQAEPPVGERRGTEFRRGEGREGSIPAEILQQNRAINVSVDPACPPHVVDTHYRHASAFTECSGLLSTVAHRPGDLHRGSTEWSSAGPRGHYSAHSVLSQHTEELISKIERVGETTVYNSERGERAYRFFLEVSKENTPTHDAQIHSDVCTETLAQDVTPKSPRRAASMGIPPTPLEIHIPRTVFYGAEETLERKRASSQIDKGQDREGGKGIERRDSWRIGKPLSRIESLREKMRQRERERMRSMERGGEDGGEGDGTENTVTQRGGDRYEERGIEMGRELEASAHIKKGVAETEREQEGLAAHTFSTATFDVTQEVLKTSPQLPVSLPFSRADGGEEETSEFTTVVSEAISASFQLTEDEPLKYVEEPLRSDRGWQREHHSRGEEREEEDELSEEEKDNISPLSPSESISPSPLHPNSLDAMSRIYNLKTVGSRTGLCVSERAVDIPPVHLVKVQPRISHTQQESRNLDMADVRKLWGVGKHGDDNNKACSGEDASGVQMVQRQIEQFQLRDQEVRRPSHNDGDKHNTLWDRETKGQLSPRRVRPEVKEDNLKTQQGDQQTLTWSPRLGAQRVCSSTSPLKQTNQTRTVSVTPRSFRSQSPDNSLKSLGCPPAPASSPCSPSPSPSPDASPSPTSSPTLFSIRSASGAHVKRGATITVTPRTPVGDRAAMATPAGLSSAKTPAQQAQTTTVGGGAEPVKKRYPTVEEIEVIGGYQNLERSCLIKSRGTQRRVKVCFDETQLEQVCEYPSETSMLACTPYPHDLGKDERSQEEEEAQEEEREERAVIVSNKKSVGTAIGRVLRVDESCPW